MPIKAIAINCSLIGPSENHHNPLPCPLVFLLSPSGVASLTHPQATSRQTVPPLHRVVEQSGILTTFTHNATLLSILMEKL